MREAQPIRWKRTEEERRRRRLHGDGGGEILRSTDASRNLWRDEHNHDSI